MKVGVAKLLDRWLGGVALALLRPVRGLQDLLGGYGELRAVREIAVVKFWGIGNAALLLPILRALKRRYPAARLTVVTLEGNRPMLEGACDRLLTVRFGLALFDLVRAAALLRRDRVDLAVDFEQYVRASQVLLYLAGARQVIAFDTPGQDRARLAEVRVAYDDSRHTSESFFDLVRAAGVRGERYRPGGLAAEPEAAAGAAAWCEAAGALERPLVLLHPGSGDNFPGRRWPTRRFGLLARRLVDERGAVVAVTGLGSERRMAREVIEASGRELHNLCGQLTLPGLIALLARSRLLVSNDTGPVHVASALEVPVLALFGPNTPRLYGPLSEGSAAFYDAPPCSPCITNFNYKTSRCRNPVCIRAIQTAEVAEAALRLLPEKSAEKTA